jgi:hypothetical protein
MYKSTYKRNASRVRSFACTSLLVVDQDTNTMYTSRILHDFRFHSFNFRCSELNQSY